MQQTDWSEYQTFLAIARTGRIGSAAKATGVDGTTMGRRLRRLERRLGATLFEQTREGQILTETGEALLSHVEAMALAAANIGEEQVAGGLAGTLRISVSEGFGSWFLSRFLAGFAADNPALTIDLVANSGFLSPSKREADLAVTLSRPKAGPVIARKLSDYALRLYASPDYLADAGKPGKPADLARDHRLVGYIPDLLYAPELGYLDEIGPGLRVALRSSSINAQHRLIAAGAGVGVLPCFIGDADPRLICVLPEQRILRSFWLVRHRDTANLTRVRTFTAWLVDCVQRHRRDLLPS
jgi:DNA-binding transcriptional LysR family regulator